MLLNCREIPKTLPVKYATFNPVMLFSIFYASVIHQDKNCSELQNWLTPCLEIIYHPGRNNSGESWHVIAKHFT